MAILFPSSLIDDWRLFLCDQRQGRTAPSERARGYNTSIPHGWIFSLARALLAFVPSPSLIVISFSWKSAKWWVAPRHGGDTNETLTNKGVVGTPSYERITVIYLFYSVILYWPHWHLISVPTVPSTIPTASMLGEKGRTISEKDERTSSNESYARLSTRICGFIVCTQAPHPPSLTHALCLTLQTMNSVF